ncbi:MAG: glycosyltransferase family 4 protein [Flavobacteriales bacterium]
MKVLLVIDSLGSGGAQRQIVALAKGLCSRGHEVTIVYYNGPHFFLDKIEKLPIKVEFLHKKSKMGFEILWKIRNIIRRNSFDVGCAFMIYPSYFLTMGNVLALKKIKTVTSERTYEKAYSSLVKKFRFMYKFTDRILANSFHQRDVLLQIFPQYKHKIGTIGNGVFLDDFKFRSNHIFDSNHFKIVAVGRIVALKNIRVLVNALNILVNQNNINAYVNYIGREPVSAKDIAEHQYCLQLLKDFNIENRWNWIGEVNNVEEYLQQNDALVHGSLGEGFPNAVCEAMTKGIPVFASNVYDHPKVIEHGKSGYVFDPLDANSLASSLKEFHELTQDQKQELVRKARTYAENNFDISIVTKKYEDLFLSLISKK